MLQKFKNHKVMVVVSTVVLCMVLIAAVVWGMTVIPAASATVKITPTSANVSKIYTLFAIDGNPDVPQITHAHVSSVTKSESKTVKLQKETVFATHAQGQITFTLISGTTPSGPYRVTGNSGVMITFALANPISSGSVTVDAQAEVEGDRGNIPAYDIDASWYPVDNPSEVFDVVNTQAFTGGHAEYQIAGKVDQSDIDDAATPIAKQLPVDTEVQLRTLTLKNETFIESMMECKTVISSNHKVDDITPDVTVKVTSHCTGVAIDKQNAIAAATSLYQQDPFFQPSSAFAGITVSMPLIDMKMVDAKTFTTPFIVTGKRVYQFSEIQKQEIAKLIAGKPKQDALSILLKQKGVNSVSITTDGIGSAVPTLNNIKMVIQPVS